MPNANRPRGNRRNSRQPQSKSDAKAPKDGAATPQRQRRERNDPVTKFPTMTAALRAAGLVP